MATALSAGLSSRLRAVPPSARQQREGLSATDLIRLSAGDPDFPSAPHVVAAAEQALREGRHHYTPPAGLPALRAAIAADLQQAHQLDYRPQEIIVTAGAQEALMLTLLALIDPGDEVLLPTPRYSAYDAAVALCGGTVVNLPTTQADGFVLRAATIERLLTPRSKLLVLMTPANPTGAVLPADELAAIARLAVQHNLLVISDEIYSRLLFDGAVHLSIATLPGMRERTVTVNGCSKSYAMTGWRVGWLAGPLAWVEALIEARHTLSVNTATASQYAALAALTGPQDHLAAMQTAYAARREQMTAWCDRLGFSYARPQGAFFVYADISSSGLNAADFAVRMLQDAHVHLQPAAEFADPVNRHIRFSLARSPELIDTAFSRIAAALGR